MGQTYRISLIQTSGAPLRTKVHT
ncbi:uncharacterized protein FTOL_13660 [Fusarium torulosum]|uniref:Uncharacterized protein n=1 Tax=Fusarium torulosum TaxID=33205 RepID=A0AAE8MMU9_9HYPO|nr:uncharacterized protein FTOL_13660 [Fusarium torulosum]